MSEDPTNQDRAQAPSPTGAVADALREFGVIVQASSASVEKTARAVSDQMKSGPAVFLYWLGGFVIAVGLAMKVEIDEQGWAHLEPGEFVAVMILGLCLLVLGAATPLIPQREATRFQQKTVEEGGRVARGVISGTATERRLTPGTATVEGFDADAELENALKH